MKKHTSLIGLLLLMAALSVQAENMRYCAASAPVNSPCKLWLAAFLAGRPPANNPQEMPRYQADSTLARQLSAYHRSDIPGYGAPSLLSQQPFAQTASWVIVR
ncbi:MAG: hypothetical protein ACKO69_08755 [Limnohabitans sp.]